MPAGGISLIQTSRCYMLNRLAAKGQIAAFSHTGFWQCMDTYREQQLLTHLWTSGKAPWKVW